MSSLGQTQDLEIEVRVLPEFTDQMVALIGRSFNILNIGVTNLTVFTFESLKYLL